MLEQMEQTRKEEGRKEIYAAKFVGIPGLFETSKLAMLGGEDRVAAHVATAKLEEKILIGYLPEKDVAQILIKLCSKATPFHEACVTTCTCGGGESKVSPLSCRTAITALGCLRNILKKTRGRELSDGSGTFPGWRVQAFIWASLEANDFEPHLKILTHKLVNSSPIISRSSGQKSCACTTTTTTVEEPSVDVSKEAVLGPSMIELILVATLRLLSSAVKLESEALSFDSERGQNEGALQMICGLVERTWELLIDTTAEPHFHAEKDQCLFGYIQHKLMTVVLHLAPYFPERPAMAYGCIRAIGRHRQQYFAPYTPVLDPKLSSSDLHSSPFYSSWLASSPSLDPTTPKPFQEAILPNNVKIRAFLVLLKAVGSGLLSSSVDNKLQIEALSLLVSALQLMLRLWQPDILQRESPNHVRTVSDLPAEDETFDEGDSDLCASKKLLQLLQEEYRELAG